jgi:uncharacterized protein YndB with AHSA1/START domain
MPRHRISASALIAAPPERVYAVIANYRDSHPRILPRPPFGPLTVEEGGVGAGTVITFDMRLLGQLQHLQATVTEPEPGRVLVETDLRSGAVTTFTVDRRADGREALTTITTEIDVPRGLLGRLQAWMLTRLLQPVYTRELDQLAEVVQP